MKVLIITTFYEIALPFVLSEKDYNLGYDDLVGKIDNSHFRFYSSLKNYAFENDAKVNIIYPNLNFLQDKWSKKENIQIKNSSTLLASQLEYYKPDVILLNSDFNYYHEIKTLAQNIPVVGWVSCPIHDKIDFHWLRKILSLYPPHIEYFTQLGIPARLVNAGFDPALVTDIANERNVDFSFVGGISPLHYKRIEILKYLSRQTSIELWGYGFSSSNLIKNLAKKYFLYPELHKRYRGQAWAKKMFDVLGDSKITINIHGDFVETPTVNMRLYEATGMGALLLTEHHDSLADRFKINEEIITYKNKEDAVDKVKYFLKNTSESEQIAKNGQARTLRDYNYKDIAKIIFQELRSVL